ncbi:hypothetical protein WJX84_010898 [Apatococcus fuscideae]|uniref:Glycerol-3-phosphate dehydrogenase n=1 Tax=Apatococcus fuscideae TaxID=2026836 RepID=A0AAW1SPW9_9CHLO
MGVLSKLGFTAVTGATGLALWQGYQFQTAQAEEQTAQAVKLQLAETLPSRKGQLQQLQTSTADKPFDVLIIGGGATGAGCALDAISRGLRTVVVEKEDFGAGTSSRSTKLVHGGVRYLEKAVFNADYGQLKLVFEALHERRRLLEHAPFLAHPLPIMTPCYKWWEIPYYWAGLKAYDLVAGSQGLTISRFSTAKESHRQFPTLSETQPDGQTLKGTIVYYDGQFNDSRMNVLLACTAARAGAIALNHAEVTKLLKDDEGKLIGATVHDLLSGKKHNVHAHIVINATGPFADNVRHLSDPNAPKMIMPSAGVHVTLPDYYSPENIGMIIPKTKDGRVVFMLPWLGATIAGTTDSSSEITMTPRPTETEINFILDAIAEYLTVRVRRTDVLSAWSGIRPLAVDPNAKDTASASRDHIVSTDPDGLITVTGGKWTTYRLMAEDAINAAVATKRIPWAGPCGTKGLAVVGTAGWNSTLFTEVAQNYTVPHRPGAIDTRVAKHLADSYGDRAQDITKIAEHRNLGKRLARGYPMLEAEVIYAMESEMCETPEDFIARRTRLAFLDTRACEHALPRIVELMAAERGWWWWRRKAELKRAKKFLQSFTPSNDSRTYSIAIEADAAVARNTRASGSNGTLSLESVGNFQTSKPVKLTIFLPGSKLNEVTVNSPASTVGIAAGKALGLVSAVSALPRLANLLSI